MTCGTVQPTYVSKGFYDMKKGEPYVSVKGILILPCLSF